MDIGATWLSCKIQMQDELREVLLGVDSMKKHLEQTAFLGATIGRYANRIKAGQFVIDGQSFQISRQQSMNMLHGGLEGFDKRRWQVVEQKEDKITFSLSSADGDQGFPGNLLVHVSYQFSDNDEVSIEYYAKTDKTCPVNLTNHSYFNLMGADLGLDCLGHHLQINADQYLPSYSDGIPVGEIQSVQESSFNFLTKKTIEQDFLADKQQQQQAGYDHAFLLNANVQDAQAVALTLTAPDGSLELIMRTDKPSVHVYTGNFLTGCPSRTDTGYQNHAGIALEAQFPPDSPNNMSWLATPVYLHPQEEYRSTTRYAFNHTFIETSQRSA